MACSKKGCKGCRKCGGHIPKYPDGGKINPYVAKDKADFDYRNQMYADSLSNYLQGKEEYDNYSAEKKDYSSLEGKYSGTGPTGFVGFEPDMYINKERGTVLGDHLFRVYAEPKQKVLPPSESTPRPAIPKKMESQEAHYKILDNLYTMPTRNFAVEKIDKVMDGDMMDKYVRPNVSNVRSNRDYASANFPGKKPRGMSREEYNQYFLEKKKSGGYLPMYQPGGTTNPYMGYQDPTVTSNLTGGTDFYANTAGQEFDTSIGGEETADAIGAAAGSNPWSGAIYGAATAIQGVAKSGIEYEKDIYGNETNVPVANTSNTNLATITRAPWEAASKEISEGNYGRAAVAGLVPVAGQVIAKQQIEEEQQEFAEGQELAKQEEVKFQENKAAFFSEKERQEKLGQQQLAESPYTTSFAEYGGYVNPVAKESIWTNT
jgi:hypothetical protein